MKSTIAISLVLTHEFHVHLTSSLDYCMNVREIGIQKEKFAVQQCSCKTVLVVGESLIRETDCSWNDIDACHAQPTVDYILHRTQSKIKH